MTTKRVLLVSLDPLGEHLAGPAIRSLELARVLSKEVEVTLAVPAGTDSTGYGVRVVPCDGEGLSKLASQTDVLIVSGRAVWSYPFLKRVDNPIVVDVYDPFGIESLPLLSRESDGEQIRRHGEVVDAITDLLTCGDFFVCASEKQRDFWLGWLEALNRVNPATYRDDPTLRNLVDVVPFGLPVDPPQHTRVVLKGVRPGVGRDDRVILWGGGVYNWFDPLTLIKAVARIAAERTDVKLFFAGIRHPTPGAGGGDMADRAVALSRELGLLDTCVYFNEWTPYGDRQNYLLEADLGVSLHFANVETHLSFRTRLLDYIWASLPMVVTRGDVLSDLVEQERLGWTVDYEDVEQVVAAIGDGLEVSRSEFSDRFAAVAHELVWDKVARPLVDFCLEPRLAADRGIAPGGLHSLPALKLVSELSVLRRDCLAKDGQLVELGNLLRRAEVEVAKRDAAVELRQSEVSGLRHTVDALRQRVAELEESLRRLEQESAELRRLLETKDAEIARLHEDLRRSGAAAREQRIEHLEAVRLLRDAKDMEIGAARDELERVRADARAQHVQSLEAIQQLKDDRHAEAAALRDELERTKIDALSSQLECAESTGRLKQAHDAAVQALREATEVEVADLRARLDAIAQGRLVRLLNRASRFLRGRPFI